MVSYIDIWVHNLKYDSISTENGAGKPPDKREVFKAVLIL